MSSNVIAKRENDVKDDNLFIAFLEEYERQPAIDVVYLKRERFERLHRIVVKSLFLGDFKKCWHVTAFMYNMFDSDEYKDEYIDASPEDVITYFEIILALCAFKSQTELLRCVEFCQSVLEDYGLVYPMLYSILAGCYLKLKCKEQAAEVIVSGLDFIIANFQLIESTKQKLQQEQTFFTVRNFGENSPRHLIFALYAYGKLIKLNMEKQVKSFCKEYSMETEHHALNMLLSISNFDGCCFGSQVNEALRYQKLILSIDAEPSLKQYLCELSPDCNGCCRQDHVPTHCTLQPVVVNYSGMNGMIYVNSFHEVPFVFHRFLDFDKLEPPLYHAQPDTSSTYVLPAFVRDVRRVRKPKITLRIGKPYGVHHMNPLTRCENKVVKMFQQVLSPLLKQFSKHVLIEGEMGALYLQVLEAETAANRLYDNMDATNMHLMAIRSQYDMEIHGRNSKHAVSYIKKQIDILCRCVRQWRLFAQQTVGEVHFQCFPDDYHDGTLALKEWVTATHQNYIQHAQNHAVEENQNFRKDFNRPCGGHICECELDRIRQHHYNMGNGDGVLCCGRYLAIPIGKSSRAVKETQTNYSKSSCRTKQTQTDKHNPEEQNFQKHINMLESALTKKVAELEGKILELQEARKDLGDNQNKTLKALKRELSQAKRTILEKNKDIQYQKHQIEQLQNNLSKLNKSYSHVVKPPDDLTKPVCSKSVIKENEKLQVLNANLSAENANLQRQLNEMTDEFDRMKARRDALIDTNEEVQLLYKEKSEQYDELYDRISCLKNEYNDKFKTEQDKVIEMQNVIINGIEEFINLLIAKISQYKVRCERMHEELTHYFYTCNPNLNIKQMCEANQLFLSSVVAKLERNVSLLLLAKDCVARSENRRDTSVIQHKVIAINWKDLIVYTDEFCTSLFNQYLLTVNAMMPVHSALSNALLDNARLISQSLMDQDKLYRPQDTRRVYNTAISKVPQPNHGPVGSNRPLSSMSNYSKVSRAPSPEIDDPSTKNILSQIAHAVNYPTNITLGNNRGVDMNGGAVRRPATNLSSTSSSPVYNASTNPAVFRQRSVEAPRVDRAMKENYNWNQQSQYIPSNVSVSPNPGSSSESTVFMGKYRDIYLAVKKRFPNALMNDLINALNFLKAMNVNLHKISMETIFDNVGNYIEHQMQLRLQNCEAAEEIPPRAVATDEFCSICFEKMNSMPSVTLKCSHIFHEKCVSLWLRQNTACPICRKFTIME